MKKLLVSLTFLFVVFLMVCETFTLKADEWYPYNGEPNSDKEGYGLEIIRQVFSTKGINIDYSLLNWARAVHETERGTTVSVIGATLSEIDAIFPEEPIGILKNTFITKKDSTWNYKDINSLYSTKLGVILDYSYDSDVDNYVTNSKDRMLVQTMTGDTPLINNIKKLMVGRVDVIIDDYNVLMTTLENMKLTNKIRVAGNVPVTEDNYIYIAFSKKNPRSKFYARIFDEGIRELRKTGQLKQILQNYNLKDWK